MKLSLLYLPITESGFDGVVQCAVRVDDVSLVTEICCCNCCWCCLILCRMFCAITSGNVSICFYTRTGTFWHAGVHLEVRDYKTFVTFKFPQPQKTECTVEAMALDDNIDEKQDAAQHRYGKEVRWVQWQIQLWADRAAPPHWPKFRAGQWSWRRDSDTGANFHLNP